MATFIRRLRHCNTLPESNLFLGLGQEDGGADTLTDADCPPARQVCLTDPPLWVPGGDIKVITNSNPAATPGGWSKPRLVLSAESGGGIPKVCPCIRPRLLGSFTPNFHAEIAKGKLHKLGLWQVICNRMVVLSTGEWLLPYWREQSMGAVEEGTCKAIFRETEVGLAINS